MRHQSGEGEGRKKRHKPVEDRRKTGSRESERADVLMNDDIDPADFFDPEEFGFRHRGLNASRP
jgi:hypothetical protein